jgi:D-lactate dehydrogenase (quinone)
VVRPDTLLAYWRALQACIKDDAIVIIQAQNTGLTEGSTPSGAYDRPVVIINTLRLDGLQLGGPSRSVRRFGSGKPAPR